MLGRQLKIGYGILEATLILPACICVCTYLLLQLNHLLVLLALTLEDEAADTNVRTRLVKLLIVCCCCINPGALLLH